VPGSGDSSVTRVVGVVLAIVCSAEWLGRGGAQAIEDQSGQRNQRKTRTKSRSFARYLYSSTNICNSKHLKLRSQHNIAPCVSSVYFKVTGIQPLTGLSSVRQKGGYPDPPPVVPIQNPSLPRRPIPRLYCHSG
jgi:hypothetical protein